MDEGARELFAAEQLELMDRLLPTLTAEQRAWLARFLGGPAVRVEGGAEQAPRGLAPGATVLFGSQTGHSQELAQALTARLEARGLAVAMAAMDDYEPRRLARGGLAFILVSTHGDGDPPDNALPLYEFLHGHRAPRLTGLRYSVLALGDRSYEHFCATGRALDRRLAELGAERAAALVECDVDYDEAAEAWVEASVAVAAGHAGRSEAAQVATIAPRPSGGAPAFSRRNPFAAEVLENVNLNGRGSNKETRHLELSLAGSGLAYAPGDSLGVYPENDPQLVAELIRALDWSADQPFDQGLAGSGETVRDALARDYEITRLTPDLVERVIPLQRRRAARRHQEMARRAYVDGRDLLDLVRDLELGGVAADELLPQLRRMPARLYSIASSQASGSDEVHLAVRVVREERHGRLRPGVCSSQCAERVAAGDSLPVYVHRNPNFKMPADPATPLIMIGPGTGVAPFRAFLQEREAHGGGPTWLFYGDWRFRTDFLYQIEWQRWLREGVLTRMDVAFSRDGPGKVYVQERLTAHAREVFAWLGEGAAVYVCGDEKRMAPDVDRALQAIVAQEGGLGAEEAGQYLARMRRERHYQRDVY